MSSHATGWGEDAPSPAQIKEFFAQIESGRVTKEGVQKFLKGCSDEFGDEEINSDFQYPQNYQIKSIAEQTNILRQLFPGIGYADEKFAECPLSLGAEGWFAIPKWQMLGKTYEQALEKVIGAIRSHQQSLHNYRGGMLDIQHLRQHTKAKRAFQSLSDRQDGNDILVVPAQFGLRHRGRSVRRARKVFASNEFGLPAFAVGCMLLTHPERFQNQSDLAIDCAGDMYDDDAGDGFTHAPYFLMQDGGLTETLWKRADQLVFGCGYYGGAQENYGSASAFL
jgi:hypothetical protein